MLPRAWGLARSLAIYHGIPGRQRRLRRQYGQFIAAGDLTFDIGAHVGNRVRAWRRLGARVVAVEPQPDCLRVLRLLFGRDDDVVVVPAAVGARPGRARLNIATAAPTVSTMSGEWMASVSADRRFARVRWDRSVDVDVTTLDDLIASYGEPVFCKIDVEGLEVDVLRGLSRPLRGLSVEYLPQAHDEAVEAVGMLQRLGDYRYNYSPVETMRMAADDWLDADGLLQLLEEVRPRGHSGDIYARLV